MVSRICLRRFRNTVSKCICGACLVVFRTPSMSRKRIGRCGVGGIDSFDMMQ